MIEYLEADLTGAPKEDLNTENVVLAAVEHAYEAITAKAKSSNKM